MINWFIVWWFLTIILSEALALYFVKKFSINQNHPEYLVYSMGLYCLTVWSLSKILIYGQGIALINILWNIASSLYGIAIGVFIFGEYLTNLQLIGGVLGILSIILLTTEEIQGKHP